MDVTFASVEEENVAAKVTVGVDGDGAGDSGDSDDDPEPEEKDDEDDEEEVLDKKPGVRSLSGVGDVMAVQCGGNDAEFHVAKFARGSKGPCILFKDEWLTPNEFQFISGRESCKDWKRSIRYQGRPIQQLLTMGLLNVHPPDCSCKLCQFAPGPATIRIKEEKRRRLNPSLGRLPENACRKAAVTPVTHSGESKLKISLPRLTGSKRKPVAKTWTVAPFAVGTGTGGTPRSINGQSPGIASSSGNEAVGEDTPTLNSQDPEWSPCNGLGQRKRRKTVTPVLRTRDDDSPASNCQPRSRRRKESKSWMVVTKPPAPNKLGLLTNGESPEPREVMTWSVEDVAEFISAQGFEYYAHRFREEEVNGVALLDIREEHLLDRIQMRLGPALQLYRAIRQIQCP